MKRFAGIPITDFVTMHTINGLFQVNKGEVQCRLPVKDLIIQNKNITYGKEFSTYDEYLIDTRKKVQEMITKNQKIAKNNKND